MKLDLGYYPETVAERMSPDPLPPGILKASAVLAFASALAWMAGVWPGKYAVDVLENVLVGLGGTLIGAGAVSITLT